MYNQQTQGNPLLQAREYSQPSAGVADVGSNGEKKTVRYSDYQGIQQVPQQSIPYTTLQEPMDDYHLHQYVSQGYPYSMVYGNRPVYNKPQGAYYQQVPQEKQLNGKVMGSNDPQYYDPKLYQTPELAMNHMGYYATYAASQQMYPTPTMFSSLQYPNNNIYLQQQIAMQYQVPGASVKRDYPSTLSYTTVDKGKKQQVNTKQTSNRISPSQNTPSYQTYSSLPVQGVSQRTVTPEQPVTQPDKSIPQEPANPSGRFNEMERAVASILCGMKTPVQINQPQQAPQILQPLQVSQISQIPQIQQIQQVSQVPQIQQVQVQVPQVPQVPQQATPQVPQVSQPIQTPQVPSLSQVPQQLPSSVSQFPSLTPPAQLSVHPAQQANQSQQRNPSCEHDIPVIPTPPDSILSCNRANVVTGTKPEEKNKEKKEAPEIPGITDFFLQNRQPKDRRGIQLVQIEKKESVKIETKEESVVESEKEAENAPIVPIVSNAEDNDNVPLIPVVSNTEGDQSIEQKKEEPVESS